MIDTHSHLDDEAFRDDLPDVIQRAREAGVEKVFVPAIDLPTSERIIDLCHQYPDYLYPLVGLHPEEVRADWREQLSAIRNLLLAESQELKAKGQKLIAIGEVGLDFY